MSLSVLSLLNANFETLDVSGFRDNTLFVPAVLDWAERKMKKESFGKGIFLLPLYRIYT